MTTVYILVSKLNPEKYNIGMTDNLEQRIKIHNNGEVTHTSKYIPWEIDTFIEFTNKEKAISLSLIHI